MLVVLPHMRVRRRCVRRWQVLVGSGGVRRWVGGERVLLLLRDRDCGRWHRAIVREERRRRRCIRRRRIRGRGGRQRHPRAVCRRRMLGRGGVRRRILRDERSGAAPHARHAMRMRQCAPAAAQASLVRTPTVPRARRQGRLRRMAAIDGGARRMARALAGAAAPFAGRRSLGVRAGVLAALRRRLRLRLRLVVRKVELLGRWLLVVLATCVRAAYLHG